MRNLEKQTTMSLGQKAFTVFCDVAAKDAVVRNTELRLANAALQAVNEAVHSLQILIRRGTEVEVLYECDVRLIQDEDTDDSTMLIYTVEDDKMVDFPLDDLPRLWFRLSGVGINTGGWFGKIPDVWVSHKAGTVGIDVDFSNDVSIEGKVENYGGTLDDIQRLIDTNRICHHWRKLGSQGMVNVETGQPPRWLRGLAALGEDYLDGATLKLEKLWISKDLILPIHALESPVSLPSMQKASNTREDQELEDLVGIMPFHKELRQALADRESLRDEKVCLDQLKAHYQSFRITFSEGSISLKLDSGRSGTMFKGNHPAWTLEPPETQTLHLTAIPGIEIRLANVPISSLLGPLYAGQPMFTEDGLMILQYGGGIEVVFAFDDSLRDLDHDSLQANVLAHVQVTLLTGNRGREAEIGGGNTPMGQFRMTTEGGQVVRPLSNLTMSLLWVSIRLESVHSHLKLLGIDTSEEGCNYSVEHEAPADDEAQVEGPAEGEEG